MLRFAQLTAVPSGGQVFCLRAACSSRNARSVLPVASYPSESQRRSAAEKVLKLVSEIPRQQSAPAETREFGRFIRHRSVLEVPASWNQLEKSLQGDPRPVPTRLKEALSPRQLQIPDVEQAAEQHCQLTLRPSAQLFKDESLNTVFSTAFREVVRTSEGKVQLTRFDLFHGHLFLTRGLSRSLGVLFHTAEYPALDPEFKINLGYCQIGSSLSFDQLAFDTRNWLLFKGQLVSLDAGDSSALNKALLMEGLERLRTMLEADFGDPLADIYYFPSLHDPLYISPFKEGEDPL